MGVLSPLLMCWGIEPIPVEAAGIFVDIFWEFFERETQMPDSGDRVPGRSGDGTIDLVLLHGRSCR